MSEASKVINGIIEQKLLNLHTAYFATVLSVNGNSAKIQPLNMIKAAGQSGKKQAVLTAPVLKNVCKLSTQKIKINDVEITIPKVDTIAAGDIVYCLCAERDITETKKGKFSIFIRRSRSYNVLYSCSKR